MQLKTKFEIGQLVWFDILGKPQMLEIKGIFFEMGEIRSPDNGKLINYQPKFYYSFGYETDQLISEDDIFLSLSELVESYHKKALKVEEQAKDILYLQRTTTHQ